jgi:hypothetical protein
MGVKPSRLQKKDYIFLKHIMKLENYYNKLLWKITNLIFHAKNLVTSKDYVISGKESITLSHLRHIAMNE